MTENQAGMMVKQEALDWWPYIGIMVDRINKACEKMDPVVMTDIFLDAANLLNKTRIDTTVNGLRKELKTQLSWYRRYAVKDILTKKRRLENPIGQYGKPLAETTLKQYRSSVKGWPKRRERLKEEIRGKIAEIKRLSCRHGKIISRGNVSLRLIYGGQYPAGVVQRYQASGWLRVR